MKQASVDVTYGPAQAIVQDRANFSFTLPTAAKGHPSPSNQFDVFSSANTRYQMGQQLRHAAKNRTIVNGYSIRARNSSKSIRNYWPRQVVN
jgi:hypothetical protein